MADCFKDAVCVDCGRVYDSCCSRDCLEDLRVYLSPNDQETANTSAGARVRSCEIINVCIEVEPVTFNRGYYSVDMMFYFLLNIDLYPAASSTPVNVNGVALWNKKVILFGSDGNAKTFSNVYGADQSGCGSSASANLPRASVQTVDPIILNSSLLPVCRCDGECCCTFPKSVTSIVGDIADESTVQNKVVATLGLFTVVQLIRNVQMLIPCLRFLYPRKGMHLHNRQSLRPFQKNQIPSRRVFSRLKAFPTNRAAARPAIGLKKLRYLSALCLWYRSF